jgi:hypothetical protein
VTDKRRRHDVPTGRRNCAPKGNVNALRYRLRASVSVENRKAFAKLMREARAALRQAD